MMTPEQMIAYMERLKAVGFIADYQVFVDGRGNVTSILGRPKDAEMSPAQRVAYLKDVQQHIGLLISEPVGRA